MFVWHLPRHGGSEYLPVRHQRVRGAERRQDESDPRFPYADVEINVFSISAKFINHSKEEKSMATISAFAKRLATVAQEQHSKFQFTNEADPLLCKQIRKWTEDIGFSFTSCTTVPWSAVFVSWCVKQAGATKSEFKFAMAHSVFVNQAIKNATKGEGVFHGLDVSAHPPDVGDIIQQNRGGNKFDFAFAKTHANYISHSVIVVEIGRDAEGGFAFCIGGNEQDSVRRSVVRLDSKGFVKQRSANSFICVVDTLK